jgi:hypothetical protein
MDLDSDPKSTYYLDPTRGNNPLFAPDYGLGLTATDINNDGHIDFLENINYDFGDNRYWITRGNAYLNDGSGNFVKVSNAFDFSLVYTGWTLGMSSTVVDVDGGYPDMLVSEQISGGAVSSKVYLLTGLGNGTFELFDSDGSGEFNEIDDYVFQTNNHPATYMTLGDFNNDGNTDAIVGQDDDGDPGAAFLFVGHGDGTFDQTGIEVFDTRDDIESGADQPGIGRFQAYDADQDSVLDIISASGHLGPISGYPTDASLLFFRGQIDGGFVEHQVIDTNILMPTAFTAPFVR